MISSIMGGRLRRTVAIQCLFASAFMGQAGYLAAQQVGGDQFNYNNFVSDGATGQAPDNYGCGDCVGQDGSCAGCGSCVNDGSCGSGSRGQSFSGWFQAEWLHWQLNGNDLPPLVTDAPLGSEPVLGEPGTQILSGDETVNDNWRNGYRISAGFWLDCCHCWGIGVDYFDAGDDDYNFSIGSEANRIVGRPFFDTDQGIPSFEPVSIPDELDGRVDVDSGDSFQGAGLTLHRCLWRCCDPCCQGNSSEVALLGGYRYYQYDSDLTITENLTVLPDTQTQLVPGTTFFVQDSFRTRNVFNGAEIGLQGFKRHCGWWVDGMVKFAVGGQSRTVTVDGETVVTVPDDDTATAAGGLLTSEFTNIGRYKDTDFVVIPELRLGVGAMVTCSCAVRAGYNVIFWNDVARAASHLPPGLEVDPRNLPFAPNGPGGPEPVFPGIRGSELVAHGFDLSVMWQY